MIITSLILGYSAYENRTILPKMLGVFLIVSMAYQANSAWVFSITIFIVATLITELDFLERLAAILSKNHEYFKSKGSNNDAIKEKNKEAIQEVIQSNSDLGEVSNIVNKYKNFEDLVFKAIDTQIISIIGGVLDKNVVVSSKRNKYFMMDAILKLPNKDIIFEIKYSNKVDVIHVASKNVERAKEMLVNYYGERSIVKDIETVVIIPSDVQIGINSENTYYLKFNEKLNKFEDIQYFLGKVVIG